MKEPDIEVGTPSLRERLRSQLDPNAREELSPLNKVIAFLIVASVLLGILATEPAIRNELGYSLPLIELALGFVFLAELLARVWTQGLNPEMTGLSGTLRYLSRPLVIVDVVVVITLLLPSFGAELAVMRLLRILRLIALAKFGRYSEALILLGRAVTNRRYELSMTITLAGFVFLVSATGMYAIEGAVQPEAFGSIPRALWWSLTTLTTVGYGDVYPITPLGRIFAGLTALAGIGLIAMPTGILASAFSEITRKTEG